MLGKIIDGVTGAMSSYQEGKKVKAEVEVKLAELKQAGMLKDKEWELLSQRGQPASWKDEYVTVFMTIMLVAFVFFPQYADVERFNAVVHYDSPFGHAFMATVLSALGYKWKRGAK